MDKATENAWQGWHSFTKAITLSAIGGACVLVLLAIVIP